MQQLEREVSQAAGASKRIYQLSQQLESVQVSEALQERPGGACGSGELSQLLQQGVQVAHGVTTLGVGYQEEVQGGGVKS